jgi:hypothetical protein
VDGQVGGSRSAGGDSLDELHGLLHDGTVTIDPNEYQEGVLYTSGSPITPR